MLLQRLYISLLLNPSKLIFLFLGRILYRLVSHLQWSLRYLGVIYSKIREDVLNHRQPMLFFQDFIINAGFFAFCILVSGAFSYIPRPNPICYKFLYRYDYYFFGFELSIGSLTGFLLVVSGAYLLFSRFFNNTINLNESEQDDKDYYKLKPVHYIDTSQIIVSERPSMSESSIISLSSVSVLEDDLFEFSNSGGLETSVELPVKSKAQYYWNLAPVLLLAGSWILLNILYSMKTPVNKPKNIVAWVFHVPVHFLVPAFIAIWLYIFHAPGALKLFLFSFGLQTIAISFTYLIFPNAPPSFIKLYGDNKQPTFDMIYADSLTSIDMRFSVVLHKLVYYVTPNKFASFPSFHSACACLIFFFVCHYSKRSSFKLLGLINVLGQWWSVLYLDHHWRFDCFAGILYAITAWIILKKWKYGLRYVEEQYINAKSGMDLRNGTTMGMRLFRHTRFKDFFDPHA